MSTSDGQSAWPGNVGELHQALFEIVQRRRSGTIQACDLKIREFGIDTTPDA